MHYLKIFACYLLLPVLTYAQEQPRRMRAEVVQQIMNIAERNKPVAIVYYSSDKAIAMAKELKQALKGNGYKISRLEPMSKEEAANDDPADNISYADKDTVFVITVHKPAVWKR